MSRKGFLIMDSDLHLMEPEDLWVRYLDEPYRVSPPRFFGERKESLSTNEEDKDNTDTIFGMEVQGHVIPAFANSQAAVRQSRDLKRRSRAHSPHLQVARARGFDPASTLTAMDIEGIDVAVTYGTRGRQILTHDDIAPDYAAALARATRSCRKPASTTPSPKSPRRVPSPSTPWAASGRPPTASSSTPPAFA